MVKFEMALVIESEFRAYGFLWAKSTFGFIWIYKICEVQVRLDKYDGIVGFWKLTL